MAKIFGIDISKWQKGYNYAKAKKEGVKFAILRAGYSTTKDKVFEEHYKGCTEQGIEVGAYWFSYATTTKEAKAEAKAFLKAVKSKKFGYPLYMDVESAEMRKLSKKELTNIITAFAKVIEDAGYYFGVYTNLDWYEHLVDGKTLNKSYDWWIASWSTKKPTGGNFGLWQFGGESNKLRSVKVAGVTTDQNYAYKDYPSIMKKNGLNGYKKEVVSETASKGLNSVETTKYYEKYTGDSNSLVDALKSLKIDSSYSNRKKIARANNILFYPSILNGSLNSYMLKLLKQGKLIKA